MGVEVAYKFQDVVQEGPASRPSSKYSWKLIWGFLRILGEAI